MRKVLTSAAAVALIGASSYADLQNVEVGGDIRIRGNSFFDNFSETLDNSQFTEQRTSLNITADFSDDVSAFIEIDAYNLWGDSTRDGITTGASGGGGTGLGEVSLYQGYITLDQAFGRNVTTKIGRQEVMLGSEWLVGNNDTAGLYTGLSFDGITSEFFTGNDAHALHFLNLKVAETDIGVFAEDTDTDLRALYYTYTGREDLVADLYVMYVRTGLAGSDNFELFTYGGRIAGDWNAFDYEAELALQSGDTGAAAGVEDTDGWGANLEVGYTFDTNLAPRVFLGAAFFSGPDDDETGFNRLFSDWEYSEFLSNADLSNALIIRGGASVQATEKIGLTGVISIFEEDEEDAGVFAPTGALGFGVADEDELGMEFGLYATYAYSEDVAMEVGAAYFINGDEIEDAFADDEDPIYVYGEISLSF